MSVTRLSVSSILLIVLLAPACALKARSTLAGEPTAAQMSELWVEPETPRDLFFGPGGSAGAPDPLAAYRFVSRDVTGSSRGYDVVGPDGRKWSVKLGIEAQPEVVVSRLLWAVGYHQPATYYLPRWTLTGSTDAGEQPAGRFRLDAPDERRAGRWSWSRNPFVGTHAFRGLFVMMVMVNNWDLKTTQNPLYEIGNGTAAPQTRYVVRDLGASLGGTRWFFPGSKNQLQHFERELFIKSVDGSRVHFHYHGAWREPHLKRVTTTQDVAWISTRLARLTPVQWSDVFKAAGYGPVEVDRYVRRLRQKVDEGLAATSATPEQ
jgi:hypothetical protein